MKYNEWEYLNKQLINFIEYSILPKMLAYSIASIYYANLSTNENFYNIYNSIKSYVNINFESKKLVINIMNNILKNNYSLIITSYNPLIIIKQNKFIN